MGKKGKSKKGKEGPKTVKKLQHKIEKKLIKAEKESGEQPIEQLLHEFNKKQEALKEVSVFESPPPTPRSHFTLTASPESGELVLFGGEYFDGRKMTMFSDLYFYNVKNIKWELVKSPNTPPPRSGHQAVYIKSSNIPASVWIFGGEYASPTQLRFHHYRDLWTLRVRTRKWEPIKFEGPGPCARSGHRMLYWKNSIMLFGGFSDTGSKTVYFNDLWEFNLNSSCWCLIKLSGEVPAARSACSFFPSLDAKSLYVFCGYRKEYVTQEMEKGVVCMDYFRITMEKDHCGTAVTMRMSGARPRPPRGAMGSVLQSGNRALLFGGVHDEECDNGESVVGHFHNDLYVVDLDKAKWHLFNYTTEKRTPGTENPPISSQSETNFVPATCTPTTASQLSESVFTLTLENAPITGACSSSTASGDLTRILPSPRSSPGVAVLDSVLYLYGGVYEVRDRKITLDDFYCLDLSHAVSWTRLYAGTQEEQEWFGSDLEESDEESDDSDEESADSEVEPVSSIRPENMEVESDNSTDEDSDDDDELVENAPIPFHEESLPAYWSRTADFWRSLVNKGLEHSQSNSDTNAPSGSSNVAELLAHDFYERHTRNPT